MHILVLYIFCSLFFKLFWKNHRFTGSCKQPTFYLFIVIISWLKTIKIYCLIVLESSSLKLRWWQGHAPSEICKRESFLVSPNSQCLLAIFGVLQLKDTRTNLCACCHMSACLFPVSPSPCPFFSFCKYTSHIELGSTVITASFF